jgi:hypothetical protein
MININDSLICPDIYGVYYICCHGENYLNIIEEQLSLDSQPEILNNGQDKIKFSDPLLYQFLVWNSVHLFSGRN